MSTDHDRTSMTETEQAALPDVVSALAASPQFATDGVVFAARNSGLYRSDDGGQSWIALYGSLKLDEPLPTTAVAVSPAWASDRTVFAGTNGGVLRSSDGGETWQVALLPDPPPLVTALAVSPNCSEDGVVFAASIEDGVFRSADRGSSWTAWNFGLLDLAVLCIALSPNFAADETLFAGTESGLFRSTNGGLAWREGAFASEHAPVLSLAVAPDFASSGSVYAGTEAHGVWRSDDGGRSWSMLGLDTATGAVNGIAVSIGDAAVPELLVLSDTVLVSRDGGTTWAEWQPGFEPAGGTVSFAAPLGFAAGAPLLVGTVEGGVVRI